MPGRIQFESGHMQIDPDTERTAKGIDGGKRLITIRDATLPYLPGGTILKPLSEHRSNRPGKKTVFVSNEFLHGWVGPTKRFLVGEEQEEGEQEKWQRARRRIDLGY